MVQKYKLLPKQLNFNLKSFIHKYLNEDIHALTFKIKSEQHNEFCTDLVLETIKNYKKAQIKTPSLASNFCWLPRLAFEQASSEKTAHYKASLFSGNLMLDLTGGLGVDDISFSKQFQKVVSLDINTELNEIVKFNFEALKALNIERNDTPAEVFLAQDNGFYDLIYLDADRRPNANSKKFLFNECKPNIIEIWPFIQKKAKHLLIKLSPLIDIQYCVKNLPQVNEIQVISANNEVKEVLVLVHFNDPSTPIVKAVNLNEEGKVLSFESSLDRNVLIFNDESEPVYFFEPSASIIKADLSASYAAHLKLNMVAKNSHYFIGNEVPPDFMGRCFKIIKFLEFSKNSFTH
jgi:hypothetical protein